MFTRVCTLLIRLLPVSARPPVLQLPYVVESEDDSIELYNFRENDDVKDLRDQYRADLVVLVGEFPSTCGRG